MGLLNRRGDETARQSSVRRCPVSGPNRLGANFILFIVLLLLTWFCTDLSGDEVCTFLCFGGSFELARYLCAVSKPNIRSLAPFSGFHFQTQMQFLVMRIYQEIGNN